MIDTDTDAGAYVLGVLWGICSISPEGFWLRHRDPWFVETVRDRLGIAAAVQTVSSRTGPQARLKIARASHVAAVRDLLRKHGWTERNAPRRPYPSGRVDDRGFIRAWVELHSSADIARTGRRRTERPRLRIYGNRDLLSEMNAVLSAATGLPLRTPQKTPNEVTKALYYYGTAARTVVGWLYERCNLTNPAARAKILDAVERFPFTCDRNCQEPPRNCQP